MGEKVITYGVIWNGISKEILGSLEIPETLRTLGTLGTLGSLGTRETLGTQGDILDSGNSKGVF